MINQPDHSQPADNQEAAEQEAAEQEPEKKEPEEQMKQLVDPLLQKTAEGKIRWRSGKPEAPQGYHDGYWMLWWCGQCQSGKDDPIRRNARSRTGAALSR